MALTILCVSFLFFLIIGATAIAVVVALRRVRMAREEGS